MPRPIARTARRRAAVVALSACLLAGCEADGANAGAEAPAPVVAIVPAAAPPPPAPPARGSWTSWRAFVAGDISGEAAWRNARANARAEPDASILTLVDWLHLRGDADGATAADFISFFQGRETWPSASRINARLEERLRIEGNALATRAWFDGHTPQTADGATALVAAKLSGGDLAGAQATAKRLWVDINFDASEENRFLAVAAAFLTLDDHRARLDRLIWGGHPRDAGRMLARVDAQTATLAGVRLALRNGSSDAERRYQALTPAQQASPGVLYQRIYRLRRQDRYDEARALLRIAPRDAATMVDVNDWWVERRVQIYNLLQSGGWREAYDLASGHGGTSGPPLYEGEFLSGWLALRRLNAPQVALKHFVTLESGVDSVISLGRAGYWQGRALEAMGDAAGARTAYEKASQHWTTFYGQLAIEKLSPGGRITLPPPIAISANARNRFNARERARGAIILAQHYRDREANAMLIDIARELDDIEEIALAGDLAEALRLDQARVRAGKAAAVKGVTLARHAFPTIPLSGPVIGVDRELVLGLIRQESEFNPTAVSHAGARGLMQLMPATARMVAGQLGEGYSASALTRDPAYNQRLGTKHLGDLVDEFRGSWIMAVAGYNAGASRPRRWSGYFGDPRSPGVDPIDWIESIPFSETRNYVQRVLEGAQVYRAMLNGGAAPASLQRDLLRGR